MEPFGKHAVPDDQEESPGAGIRINGDGNEGGSENDLIEVMLEAYSSAASSNMVYSLRRNSGSIRVWADQQMNTALLTSGTETEIDSDSLPRSVWVENPNGGIADLKFVAKSSRGADILSDKIRLYPFESIAIGLSGESLSGGDPLANGMFDVAESLYEAGYDIHYYDEDVVDNNGAGAAYDEVVSAIQNRNVTHVAIYGHSHGGGSTHDLAERLNANRASVGTFTINITAYVDAIDNESDVSMASEIRLPPSTAYHMNYYQTNDWLLVGGFVPGANENLNANTMPWGQNLDHGTIDNDPNIISAIVNRIIQQISQP